MSDLRTRLERLKKSSLPPQQQSGQSDIIADLRARIDRVMEKKRPEPTEAVAGPDIHELLPGQIHARTSCEVFVARENYDTAYIHGNMRLEEIFNKSLDVIGALTTDAELAQLDPHGALFIDTETTGLSGGTGTYAFMVGIGFFEQNRFVVEQYLMRDEVEEMEMLTMLGERLKKSAYLVSFNGKSFDVPLLETRFVLSRLAADGLDRPHLDLLYPARRIWKRSLASCRLSSLEEHLLGVERVGDVPGELIPGIYFDYLRTRNATRMERVFYHNKLDILSMVTLTTLVNRLISDTRASCRSDGMEQYSLGRIHLERGLWREAEEAFLAALESCPYSDLEWEILKHLSVAYKRSGETGKAVQTWKDMIGVDKDRETYPFIELAKHYEHQKRDYVKAIGYAERAAAVSFPGQAAEAEIQHRLSRLHRKLEKQPWQE
jgi:uncharacterized protein YprB with RNaseH-like and TPR domain